MRSCSASLAPKDDSFDWDWMPTKPRIRMCYCLRPPSWQYSLSMEIALLVLAPPIPEC